jgi:hypothetical protein
MEEKYANRNKIGGPNHIVQIDKCKIGRRKFHKGDLLRATGFLG